MNEDLLLAKQLDSLRLEHRHVDEQEKDPKLDEFTRKRFKKIKLALRDKIRELELMLYPNLTA
jgi:hypothetical protein